MTGLLVDVKDIQVEAPMWRDKRRGNIENIRGRTGVQEGENEYILEEEKQNMTALSWS